MLSDLVFRDLVKEIEDSSSTRKKYIFGDNMYTESLLSQFSFDGIIDEGAAVSDESDTLSDLKLVPEKSIILVASGGRTLTAIKKCKSFGHDVIDYFTFLRLSKSSCVPVRFNEDSKKYFDQRKSEILKIYHHLEDNQSKDIFRKIIDFRVSLNSSYLEGFEENQSEQYFESFLVNIVPPVFYDVGGYDGFTSQKFLDYFPSGTSVIFEPNYENYKLCLEALGKDNRVTICNFGLHEKNEFGHMSGDGSESGALVTGSGDVEFKKLDDLDLVHQPTVIKMDIEGGEIAALRGAEKTIVASRCTLAISSYHSFSQLIDIPNYVLGLGDYKVYFRHYTESIYESVFFFVPR
jgi:FkbM family methyltransferase